MKKFTLALFLLLALWSISAEAATCTWTGGTGTWNNSNTASWSCGAVPGTGDAVVFDGTSGGGTVTVDSPNGAGSVTVQSITMGAFTGTLDFAANDNNVALSVSFSCSGVGARTLNLGDGTWTLTTTNITPWDCATVTNLTFNANASTIVFAGTTASARTMQKGTSGTVAYNAVSVGANSSGGAFIISGTAPFASFSATAPAFIAFGNSMTFTNAPTLTGSSSAIFGFVSSAGGTARTITLTSGNFSCSWCGVRDITFSGGTNAATDSFNLGNNTNITITPPAAGGGGGRCIGC